MCKHNGGCTYNREERTPLQKIERAGCRYELILSYSEHSFQCWPNVDELRLVAKQGVVNVHVKGPVNLTWDKPDVTLTFLAFLRDCMSAGLDVQWVAGEISITTGSVIHLIPPMADYALRQDALSQWQASYDFGQFYWRRGPGFIYLKDKRPGRIPARYTIDDDMSIAIFGNLQRVVPTKWYSADPANEWIGEGIVTEINGYMTILAPRMLNWPIPYSAI